MFGLLKLVLSLLLLLVLAFGIVYFLPHSAKLEAVEKIVHIVPESLKEQTEALLLTPPEKRAEILEELEEKFDSLKSAAGEEGAELAAETELLIEELKVKNEAQSLAEIIKEKLVDKLLGDKTASSTGCECALPEGE
jgi:hypothetical protein